MCGIAGYIGKTRKVAFLIDTLKRLEYRGYDSCGVAVYNEEKVQLWKIKGKIAQLPKEIDKNLPFYLGIAHTRWATHGKPSLVNAHPHYDCHRQIFVVHNGIIENYAELKAELMEKGHTFHSETDTEVIPHLIEEYRKKYPFIEAFLHTLKDLDGSYAIALIHSKEEALYFARNNSPLILGVAKEEFLLASDIPAIIPLTRRIINLEDGWLGILNKKGSHFMDFRKRVVKPHIERVNISCTQIDKHHYPHFMLKEIFEQPQVLANLYSVYVRKNKLHFPQLKFTTKFLKALDKIFIFACGTAYHAGFVAKYFLEEKCHIDVEIDVSSEARYRKLHLKRNNLILAISQSGETADTLAAVKEAKAKGAKVLGICNVLGSSLTKESDGIIYTLAGPEIGVASTKAYTAQIFTLYLFALHLATLKGSLSPVQRTAILKELKNIPHYQEGILKKIDTIREIAHKFSRFGCFLFLGRGINYPSALEGALKLKEISYIPAEGYPAGEMKHGPIALIDEYRAVVCIAPTDSLYHKIISNIQEIKARKGKVLAIIDTQDKEVRNLADEVITLPALREQSLTPLSMALPLQLLAYFVARNLGCEIDQPRNLAKSVTVE